MNTDKNIKCTQLDGYTSAYDYTIYDIGFIFDADEEASCHEDSDEELDQEYMYIKPPTGMGGNFH